MINQRGKKLGDQPTKSISINGYEDTGNTWHVWGSGYQLNGVFYDHWQAWVPKSISHIIFDTKYRNRIYVPLWYYQKGMKFYHRKEDMIQ